MKSLNEIWGSEAVSADSFGKLDTLIIDKCDKLVSVFPCYMEGIFQNLSNLTVTNCKSMKAIFNLVNEKQGARYETKLQDVHFETLPKLEHVFKWEKDREGIVNMKNLQKMLVRGCRRLENIFPVSTAETLQNLEYLVVWDCSELREIIAKGEDQAHNPVPFEFRKLATIKFLELPKLKSFYPGTNYVFSCPELNDLSIEQCDKLQPFGEEAANAQRQPILFSEEVINKLKSMQIQSQHAKSLSASYDYRRDNLEELHLSELKDTNIIYSFLHSNPNLKSLWLNDCSFEVLVPRKRPPQIESLGVVPKLKSLKLTGLYYLKEIGFERDAVLQRIELLFLKDCSELHIIVPPTVFLTHLTHLEVVDCGGLKCLMSPSTAKSLVQLSTMKVINCESLVEIVSKNVSEEEKEEDGDDDDDDDEEEKEEEQAANVDIIFRQLKTLELVSLESLKSFCSSKSCAFELPALESFVVSACPKLENFSKDVKTAPILQKIYVVHEKEKNRWCWDGNLQDTIRSVFENKKFFEGMDEISVSEHDDLLQIWQDKKESMPKDWFYNLKRLKLWNCEFESSYAIPSNVLRCLKSLKELDVCNCNNITGGIFEMKNDDNVKKSRETSIIFQLEKLSLYCLDKVTHVWQWQHDDDEKGIIPAASFQNLKVVDVFLCKKLKKLFPAALAKDLKMLENLQVMACDELNELIFVGKETAAADQGTEDFVFPRLTTLMLESLPRLTHFCSEGFTLKCPDLNILEVTRCDNVQLLQSRPNIKDISKLERLILSWKDASWLRQHTDQDLQSLRQLRLVIDPDDDDDDDDDNGGGGGGGDDDNENENTTTLPLPFQILDKIPNLEELTLANLSRRKDKEISIVPSQNPEIRNTMLGNLKRLTLHWLRVNEYTCLTTTLAQSCSNLRELRIVKCRGLRRLFTYSTAAKMLLIQLEEMHVGHCESLKEIVGKDQQDETTATTTKEEIIERLHTIVLDSLPNLECFYSGNDTLKFPSLIQVRMTCCPKMKFFSEKKHESSRRIQVYYNRYSDDWVFHDDLNFAVSSRFLFMEHLPLANHPELKGIWLGKVPIPDDLSCTNLKYLEVGGCKFLSSAILPSHLLPLLSNLEKLVVQQCDRVEAIFDVKDHTPTHDDDSIMILIPLKILTLQQLPVLRNVWNKDPKGRLSLPDLEEVTVNECQSIKSLFPASVAKDNNLQKLDVRNCVELVEIVAKDEAFIERSNREPIMFPRLTSLKLGDLPNLRCICSGMQILNWPVLKNVDVYHCQMLKIFATDFEGSDLYPESQDLSTAKNKQGIVPAGKVVTAKLKRLSLNKEDLIKIEQELLRVDLQTIKFLRLQNFNDESDAFPYDFFSKVPLPNLQELVVADSAFKEIFPSQSPHDIDHFTTILSQLRKLELENLHKLKSIGYEHSWVAPHLENLKILIVCKCSCLTNLLAPSTVSFSHLTQLDVRDCATLQCLFTSSTAKSLVELQQLSISNCKSLETVAVAQEEEEEANKELTLFPSLTELRLWNLPNLRCICSGIMQILNWPVLKDLDVYQCQKLKIFATDDQGPFTTDKHAFVSVTKVVNTPQLEKVSLNKEDVVMIEKELVHVDLQKVKFLRLQCFDDESDDEAAFRYDFFSKVSLPNVQELEVADSAFKEIFPSQRPNNNNDTDFAEILSKLGALQLRSLQKLESIGFEHTWVAPSTSTTVSFSNMTKLEVVDCARLEYLFTTSTAKRLVSLEELSVSKCQSLETVVADYQEGDKPPDHTHVITFPNLTDLSLSELPKLGSFYKGNSTMKFPELFSSRITQCENMKTFSHGKVVARRLREVEIDGLHYESNVDLNSSVHQWFEKAESSH